MESSRKVRNRYSGDLTVNEAGEIVGTLCPYGVVNSYGERVNPGAFGAVSELEIGLYLQHDRTEPLARSPGTLELWEEHGGLRFRARLPDTQRARDAITLVRSGVLQGMSPSFIVRDSVTQMISESSIGEREVEIIRQATLLHAALVDAPSWETATVEVTPAERNRWRRRAILA